MHKRIPIFLVGLIALLSLGIWLSGADSALAQSALPMVIHGQVVNGTAEGGDTSELTVTLHQQGLDQHEDREATTDSQGRFRFDNVVPIPGLSYAISVRYQGALYGQDIGVLSDIAPVTITVYEGTDDGAVLEAAAVSLVFGEVDRRTQTVSVFEIVNIRNASNRTYVPGPEPMKLLRFSLPPNSSGLQVQTDLLSADVLQVDKGFGLTSSVPPGDHEIRFAYRFPYMGSIASFAKSLPYGAGQLSVLLPESSMQLTSPNLGGAETVEVGGRPFRLLTGGEVPRGGEINFDLLGLPQPSFAERVARQVVAVPWHLAAPIAVGLVAASLVTYALFRRRRQEGAEEVSDNVGTEQEALLESLATLTEQFDGGEVDEGAYHSQRRQMIRNLAVLQEEPESDSQGRNASSEQRAADFLEKSDQIFSVKGEEDAR